METIPEAWERLRDYIQARPHHGIESWLVLQKFYDGLISMSRGHLDAAAGGAFLSLTIDGATVVSNQSWGDINVVAMLRSANKHCWHCCWEGILIK
jgi:hypothetical protein